MVGPSVCRRRGVIPAVIHVYTDWAGHLIVTGRTGWLGEHVARQALIVAALCVVLAGCSGVREASPAVTRPSVVQTLPVGSARATAFARAAQAQVGKTVSYDPAYVKLAYPSGDVPIEGGVCTDVVIRAFRALGVDLQVAVHKDMVANFDEYPDIWGLSVPDPNIDHRRVRNLQTYFTRRGYSMPVTERAADYLPGDIVTGDVSGRAHIAIISTVPAPDGSHYCLVHNIGAGTRIEDKLITFSLTGHYRPF
jgi:uncharacterized protein